MHAHEGKESPAAERSTWWYVAMVAILLGLIAVTAFLLARDVRQLRSQGLLVPQPRYRVISGSASTTPDIGIVADWMTFDYINRVFHLRPDALKTALGIIDGRYPRLSLRRYARESGISYAEAVARVKAAVVEARKTPSPMTP